MLKTKNKSILAYTVLFLFPFIFFSPISTGFISIGNDFDLIYFAYKKYIFEFFVDGEIPFWSPVEGAGFSLIFNPFAQFFYPPFWLLVTFLYKFDFFSLHLYVLYVLFFCSIFCFGIYEWIKKLKICSKNNAYISSLLLPCCLIFSNFLRLPNAILTIAWLPFLLLGIYYCFKKKKKIKSFTLIFFSSFCIVSGGYPYFIIYIFIFSSLYFIYNFFVFKNLKNSFKILTYAIVPLLFVLIILFPWIKGVYETLQYTQDRNLNDISYATEHYLTFKDYLGSILYPIASNTEGRFFFGTYVSFLIFYFLFSKYSQFKKNNKILIFCLILLIIILILGSANNLIFNFIWYNIDIIQNLRTWPRINILLVPILAIIISLALEFISNNQNAFKDKSILNLILITFLSIQILFFFFDIKHEYWFTWHEKRFAYAQNYLGAFAAFFLYLNEGLLNILVTITLLFVINFFFSKNIKNKVIIFKLLLIIMTFSEQFLNSNLQWSLKDWKTTNTNEKYMAKNTFKQNFFKQRSSEKVYGNNYFRDNEFSINNFLNWGNVYHNNFLFKYFDNEGNFKNHLTKTEKKKLQEFFGLSENPKKFFFTSTNNFETVFQFIDNYHQLIETNQFKFEILEISNNLIKLYLETNSNVYLNYIDNYDKYWRAFINNNETSIEKLFSTYKSVKVNKGKNYIIFKYEPL